MSNPVASQRPSASESPDLDIFAGLSSAWDSIDIINGNFVTTTLGVGTVNTISLSFPAIGDGFTIAANDLKLNIKITGSAAAILNVLVSYDSGSTFSTLEDLDSSDGFVARTYSLNADVDPSDIKIGLEITGDVGGEVATITDLKLETEYFNDVSFQTVNELALELMAEYGDRQSNAVKVAIVEKWINRVYQKIVSHQNWSFARTGGAITTVANQSNYRVYSATSKISSLRHEDGSGQPVLFRYRDALVRDGLDMSTTGRPKWFYTEGLTDGLLDIVLVPTPDAVYDLVYFGTPLPAKLVSTSNVPLPVSLIPVLLDGARYYYSQSDGHPEDAQIHLGNFTAGLRDQAFMYRIEPADDSHLEEVDVFGTDTRDGRFGAMFPSGW